jgi:plasmid maintenance system antidote protein VapI
LQQWLGVEAAFWLNLQKRYELDQAEESCGDAIRATVRPRDQALHAQMTTQDVSV